MVPRNPKIPLQHDFMVQTTSRIDPATRYPTQSWITASLRKFLRLKASRLRILSKHFETMLIRHVEVSVTRMDRTLPPLLFLCLLFLSFNASWSKSAKWSPIVTVLAIVFEYACSWLPCGSKCRTCSIGEARHVNKVKKSVKHQVGRFHATVGGL